MSEETLNKEVMADAAEDAAAIEAEAAAAAEAEEVPAPMSTAR